ncbi:MAG: hypothetical protein RLZZ280_352, partial [Pseudomonadota bacterium]
MGRSVSERRSIKAIGMAMTLQKEVI